MIGSTETGHNFPLTPSPLSLGLVSHMQLSIHWVSFPSQGCNCTDLSNSQLLLRQSSSEVWQIVMLSVPVAFLTFSFPSLACKLNVNGTVLNYLRMECDMMNIWTSPTLGAPFHWGPGANCLCCPPPVGGTGQKYPLPATVHHVKWKASSPCYTS